MMKHSTLVAFDVLLFAVLAACAGSAQGHSDSARAVRLGDTITRVDSAPTPVTHDTAHVAQASSPPPKRLPALSADAQRIAEGLVFAPRTQTWYLVAVRARRLLVDL